MSTHPVITGNINATNMIKVKYRIVRERLTYTGSIEYNSVPEAMTLFNTEEEAIERLDTLPDGNIYIINKIYIKL